MQRNKAHLKRPKTMELTKKPKTKKLTFEEVEQMLISFSTLVLKKESTDEVYWSLAKNVISKLGFVDCVIYSVDRKARTLMQRAAHGPKSSKQNKIINPLVIPIGLGIT
jgi:hypothetical protein